ncbi:UrcA family protein [Sphingomonas solaris]|uniref:UrcA family protein n=1 Tax=Alterirhizorhabdus solaris TaxID=2529389 RepID=A0A558QZR6_9SPHN|nr:UrcA family protein [Sphingomonas solaris]TVV72631.1 UrcA family protein [Sphingomonas solaris]
MTTSIRSVSFILAAGLAIAVPGVAFTAAPDADQQSARVSYRDLDLKSEQGVARLRQRVRAALTVVCGRAETRGLNANAQVNRCRAAALAKAQDSMQLAVATARTDTRLAQNTAPSIAIGAR